MSAPERSRANQRADKCIALGIQTWNEGAKMEAQCSDCNGVSAVADLWKNERGYGEWVRTEDALKVCESVARRRAIEELKALAGGATQEPGNQWDLGPVYSVGAGEILARIAAIEAEEA